MFVIDRQKSVLDYLRINHTASVTDLSQKFFVSETTIRRDLTRLEKSGYLTKTYGGAVLAEGHNSVLALEARLDIEKNEKSDIARKAVSLVKNGDILFLDSSSTSLALVNYLGRLTNLSVITHGLKIASGLAAYPHIKVYLAGGLVTSNLYSCSGVLTCNMLKGMHADKAFVSPRAIDASYRVYCANEEEAFVRHTMMEHCDQTILLCSSKKLNNHAPFYLCSLSEIGTMVCEHNLDKKWTDFFTEKGITFLY